MKSKIIVLLILSGILLQSCVSSKQKEQTISISGAFALYPLVVKWSEEYKKEHPEVRFNISAGGAGKGMADALSGTVDLGMFSREIAPEEIEKGVWWTGLAIDAVLPTISANNKFLVQLNNTGISRANLAAVFIKDSIQSWNQLPGLEKIPDAANAKLTVYTRSDACGAAGTWAAYLGGSQENLKGIGIFGDPGLAEAVAKDENGIGFNNTIYVYDIKTGQKRPGIEVLPLDLNENGKIDANENFYSDFSSVLEAIAAGIYPSPPARELYFVSKGRPQKQSVADFIKWTLTEGQKYVVESGYVPVDQEKIEAYLKQLQ